MLVVTLKHLETLYLDGDIEICISSIDEHAAHIRIEAPQSVWKSLTNPTLPHKSRC